MVSSWDYSELLTPLGLAPTLHQWARKSLPLGSIAHTHGGYRFLWCHRNRSWKDSKQIFFLGFWISPL